MGLFLRCNLFYRASPEVVYPFPMPTSRWLSFSISLAVLRNGGRWPSLEDRPGCCWSLGM